MRLSAYIIAYNEAKKMADKTVCYGGRNHRGRFCQYRRDGADCTGLGARRPDPVPGFAICEIKPSRPVRMNGFSVSIRMSSTPEVRDEILTILRELPNTTPILCPGELLHDGGSNIPAGIRTFDNPNCSGKDL